ncbi:MAG: DNA recombination protein RmuC, partial [Oscillospiraceae bacterium]|nr:DNA recombination protein RmuC [Oscillospiraceae bacterium]
GLRTNIELQNSNLRTVSQNINESLGGFRKSVNDMTAAMEQRMENLRVSMDKKLGDIQADNQKKLDEMRGVVDEKLQKTLDEKIGQSFKAVSERLEQVYKGLGEMQTLANDVGDLQKTLINVKTRGNLGELQLSRILDQIMAPSLYSENVITKRGSSDRVEFAVKLPGKSESDGPVYLPIDSKFPTSAYNALQDAYDSADQESIEQASKSLEAIIKKCAKDISDKYIDPPNTTEFAIMFLPIEGLYAEVVRRSELMEELQRKYRINVAGPTTITALLNSLQMGFKTLAIEKRSGEVWKLLSAVKKEFGNFAEVLNNAKEKINRANEEMDKLVGVRTRQIIRSLKNVEEMPELESAQQMIDSTGDAAGDVETE